MRVLLALALIIWGTSDAYHTPQHSLKEPIFFTRKTSQYDFSLNLTAGIPGMTSQLAKSSILGVVSITPKSESEFWLKVDNVKLSRPEVGISSDEEDMTYRREATLEAELQRPIKFTLQDGKVKSYTLGKNESPECKILKKSILRHFQGKFQSEGDDENQEYPFNYNITWETPSGPVKGWYVVTVSPYPEFPNEQNVYNISAMGMYEYPRYTLVHEHHNFETQGCPEVCKTQQYDNEEKSNKCNAGCPVGYEPHQMPVKEYYNAHYNFRQEGEEMMLESLWMEEKHIASMYDQDMDITIRAEYEHKGFTNKVVDEPRDQETHGELELEIVPDVSRRQDVSHDTAIFAEMYLLKVPMATERCTSLLNKIAETVIENKLENFRSQEVGEDLILLQKILALLKPEHLKQVWSKIVDKRSYKSADDKETIKRQIFVDVLPLVGTTECLEFIKSLIQEDKLTPWEIKEILTALPQNLFKYNRKNLQTLEEIRKLPQIERHHLTRSAAYITVAQVIQEACAKYEINHEYQYPMSESEQPSSRFHRTSSRHHHDDEDDEPEERFAGLTAGTPESDVECPRQLLNSFIEDVYRKLKSTQKVGEKLIYIQALTHTGSRRVLEYLAPYINASASELESWKPVDVEYLQSVTLYALHNLVRTCPMEILNYTSPIYFNRTEAPRVRIAAFSGLLRTQPPMAVLHQIARNTWQETSNEVGSYVYSALTTFGNASQPCMQLLKQRIQHVISQCKDYDIGYQHAKSFLHTFFDEVRNFGFENRFAYVPSNASAVPYSMYTGLIYNLDSLKDALYGLSIHMQGIPTEKLYEIVDEVVLGFKIRNIPHEKEDKIFGTANIISKMPQTMRFFVYHQLFYSSSYIYADAETFLKTFEPLFEHFENIFPSSGNVRKGHCVKVLIPSSLHSMHIGYTAAYPVEMDVRHPLLLSIKGEFELRKMEVKAKVIPSVFYMEHKTHHVWGPVSKQVYGVYQEQKFSWTMPFEVVCRLHQRNQTVSIDIKLPEMNKRIMRYHSEAGTYASPITFDHLPSKINRQPIETIPLMFRKEQVLGLPTLPQVYVTAHTEDMAYGYDDIPRTWEDCVDLAIQHLRNPGWRRKSINATLVPSPEGRSQEYNARIQFSYKLSLRARNLQSQSEDENKYSMDKDTSEEERIHRSQDNGLLFKGHGNLGLEKSDAERIYKEMRESPHIAHEFLIQAYSWPNKGYAELKMEFNHTYDKTKYCFMAHGEVQVKDRRSPYKTCIAHTTKYEYIPSELKYKSNAYDKQQVDFYNEMSFSSDCDIFRNPHLITKGTFTHKPHRQVLHEKFESSLDDRWLLPETHEECIKDMQNGKDLSLDCIKAIREETVYNNYKIRSEWHTEIPPVVRNITEKLNQAIKYAFYTQADIDTLTENKKSAVEINVDYVTKLTDYPILNIRVETPRETVHYHKIDGSYFQPASSVHTLHEYAISDLTNNTYFPTCAIMKEHVKTFDHKIFRLPEDSCTYMLSTHCVKDKLFAISAKNLKGSRTELTVYVGRHEIVLHPNRGSSYQVEFNNQRQEINMKSPVVLDKEAGIYVHVVPAGSKYNLVLKCAAGLKIVYDGENTKIYVHPMYKGKLCGLCSEFDGEVTREYSGVDQCLYMDDQDFAHSVIIDARTCGVSTTPRFPKMCPYGSDSNSNSDSDNSYNTASTMRPKPRTVHMEKGDKVCFSTQPAYMCPEDVEPEETERETLEFHCLPKHDATTRKLVRESKYRILRELSNKRVDFSETVSTAKSCHE